MKILNKVLDNFEVFLFTVLFVVMFATACGPKLEDKITLAIVHRMAQDHDQYCYVHNQEKYCIRHMESIDEN